MKNSEYWAKRMAALMDAEMHKADTYSTDVATAYRRAAKSLQADIERWYAKFADNNGISMAEARKMLRKDELEEFQWMVQEYIKHGEENGISADWEKQLINASSRVHISRLEALKLQCYQHAWEASGGLLDGLRLLLQKIYTSMYYHTAYEVQKGVGRGSPFAKIDTAQVNKVLSKPWAADGSDFSARIWKNRAQLVQELDAGLTQGIIRGDPPDKLIKHLSERFGASEHRTQALVQTESAHFANQAQSDNFKALHVEKYEIVAALDSRTCSVCGDMDGQQFPLSEEKPGINAPVFHTRCRCCKAPVVEDETPGKRAARNPETGKTYYVPENMTYKDWKAKVDSK
ncbi:minor capsid protein [Caproicibacterium sp. XB1]|uniref:minor capsid protein n=1 Tax=Caproicibacterium sp. XB1 TaxID=3396405 RepID=UPI0039B6FB4D